MVGNDKLLGAGVYLVNFSIKRKKEKDLSEEDE
jgi:hypothetical protein